jgi:hypothetical protein
MSEAKTLQRLHAFTQECRDDMHEPDEHGIDAEFGPAMRYTGAGPEKISFDNACVPNPEYSNPHGIDMARMDMGFWLLRKTEKGETEREWFNLADVIALARRAQF